MSDHEIRDAIARCCKETGATAMKDMGRVMAALKERYAGKLDFGKASAAVKKMLSGAVERRRAAFPSPRAAGRGWRSAKH